MLGISLGLIYSVNLKSAGIRCIDKVGGSARRDVLPAEMGASTSLLYEYKI